MLFKDRRNRILERARVNRLSPASAPDPSSAPGGSGPPATSSQSVLINHGIHTGHYPVVGMTIAQARETLTPLMNIDPGAVAVIRGQPVENEQGHVITNADQMLSFVKRSSVKGAD